MQNDKLAIIMSPCTCSMIFLCKEWMIIQSIFIHLLHICYIWVNDQGHLMKIWHGRITPNMSMSLSFNFPKIFHHYQSLIDYVLLWWKIKFSIICRSVGVSVCLCVCLSVCLCTGISVHGFRELAGSYVMKFVPDIHDIGLQVWKDFLRSISYVHVIAIF